jgi:hypothetical protein
LDEVSAALGRLRGLRAAIDRGSIGRLDATDR